MTNRQFQNFNGKKLKYKNRKLDGHAVKHFLTRLFRRRKRLGYIYYSTGLLNMYFIYLGQ